MLVLCKYNFVYINPKYEFRCPAMYRPWTQVYKKSHLALRCSRHSGYSNKHNISVGVGHQFNKTNKIKKKMNTQNIPTFQQVYGVRHTMKYIFTHTHTNIDICSLCFLVSAFSANKWRLTCFSIFTYATFAAPGEWH